MNNNNEKILNRVSKWMILSGVIILILYMMGCIYIIPEGHLGMYSRGGALLDTVSNPGIHFKLPYITRTYEIQVTVQTDQVTNIPCGTSGGIMLYFDKIEVVNRLNHLYAYQTIKNYTIDYDKTWIFNKIHHEINQFCSKNTLQEVYITQFDQLDDYLQNALQKDCNQYAPGIEIISVRVTKPKIPDYVKENYLSMEVEKIKLNIAIEAQKVTEKQQETEQQILKIQAETQTHLSKIQIQKNMILKQSTQKIEELEMQIKTDKYNNINQANIYQNQKALEVDQLRINQNYITHKLSENIKDIKKTYYGDNINSYIDSNLKIVSNQNNDTSNQ